MELLRERLVACGWTWKDDMKAMWRASVPNSVKAELLRRIGLAWFPLRSGWLKGWIFFFLSSYLSVSTLLFPYCFGEEELFEINILCF